MTRQWVADIYRDPNDFLFHLRMGIKDGKDNWDVLKPLVFERKQPGDKVLPCFSAESEEDIKAFVESLVNVAYDYFGIVPTKLRLNDKELDEARVENRVLRELLGLKLNDNNSN